MKTALWILVKRLERATKSGANVIPWSCPVPSFGDLSLSTIATLGLNPSNREFVDDNGTELDGPRRRLHTLGSLGLKRWADAQEEHLELIVRSCRKYFSKNPYDTWFKRLDYLLTLTKASYYNAAASACHLDLIPYATLCKWTFLSHAQRTLLLALAGDTLALLLKDSPVKLLVLNGKSVVEHFERVAATRLDVAHMSNWTLPRRSGPGIYGLAYHGVLRHVSGVDLGRNLLVLGFNHNIQSSFGVTKEVIGAIRDWIGRMAWEVIR